MSINKVILVGNVGGDPDVKEIGSGKKVAKFSVATTENYKKADGEKVENTEWHDVEVWGKLADIVENLVKKGKQVYVEGKIKTEKWDEPDGTKRSRTKVVAHTVQLMGKREDSN